MKLLSFLAAVVLSSTVAACDSAAGAARTTVASGNRVGTDSLRLDSIARAKQDSFNRAQPGYVVDSILPVEEELRRFRAAVGGDSVTSFANASESRDALVQRLVRGVARKDTVDLRKALVTPREFADLIYPSSQFTHPPFRQAPGLVWSGIDSHGSAGYNRLVARRGGMAFKLAEYHCNPKPEVQGANKLWGGCVVRVIDPDGVTSNQRWFGSIVERDGKFKVLSFTNQF